MASGHHNKHERRQIRRYRIRNRVTGSVERPRLSVFRSAAHIYAQIVDDTKGVTLAQASSRDDVKSLIEGKGKVGLSAAVGKLLAQREAVEAADRRHLACLRAGPATVAAQRVDEVADRLRVVAPGRAGHGRKLGKVSAVRGHGQR